MPIVLFINERIAESQINCVIVSLDLTHKCRNEERGLESQPVEYSIAELEKKLDLTAGTLRVKKD